MLYNTERPVNFSEMLGQDMNRQIFEKQIKTGNFSHAYLFAGHHGSGKTTSARIIANAAVCEHPTEDGPCGKCDACINFKNSVDVVEIDAASNTGVDAIREKVIEAVRYTPVEMRKKAIIIDEVHMLSTSAFNALLKTLEEPPAHVIIFLCTTELHKVPKTIVSRCQKFIFNAIPVTEIKSGVLKTAEKHNIQIEDKAAELIARAADGAMRDALSILDQLSENDVITEEVVCNTIGLGSYNIVRKIYDSISNGNYVEIFSYVDEFISSASINTLIEIMLEVAVDNIALGNTSVELGVIDALAEIRGKNPTAATIKTSLYSVANRANEIAVLKEKVAKLEKEVSALKTGNLGSTQIVVEEEIRETIAKDNGKDVNDITVDKQDTIPDGFYRVDSESDPFENELPEEEVNRQKDDISEKKASFENDFGNPWGW